MSGRIVNACDFERVLKTASTARTVHFAVHHVHSRPARFTPKLSTGDEQLVSTPVDELSPGDLWLGLVVPKRHAKRSVTRSLLKRQIRAAMERRPALADGLWVVRLRSPFDRKAFPSAASTALALAARTELDALLLQAARRAAPVRPS